MTADKITAAIGDAIKDMADRGHMGGMEDVIGSHFIITDVMHVNQSDSGTSTTLELDIDGSQYFIDIFKVD